MHAPPPPPSASSPPHPSPFRRYRHFSASPASAASATASPPHSTAGPSQPVLLVRDCSPSNLENANLNGEAIPAFK